MLNLGQDDDHIYCLQFHRDIGVGEVYYSGVFSGDFSSTLGYENDFYDYLESVGFEPDITESYCFVEPTLPGAERALLGDVEDDERYGFNVVQTGWRPGRFAASADGEWDLVCLALNVKRIQGLQAA